MKMSDSTAMSYAPTWKKPGDVSQLEMGSIAAIATALHLVWSEGQEHSSIVRVQHRVANKLN